MKERNRTRFITESNGLELTSQAQKTLRKITERNTIGEPLSRYQEAFLEGHPGMLEKFIEAEEHKARLDGNYVNRKTRGKDKPGGNVYFQ